MHNVSNDSSIARSLHHILVADDGQSTHRLVSLFQHSLEGLFNDNTITTIIIRIRYDWH